MSGRNYVLGADFGSDSVRAVVVDLADGSMCAEAVCTYPRWDDGLYQMPEEGIFRQHPADYLEALETVAAEALGKAGGRSAKGGTGNRGGYHRLDAVPCRPGGNLLRLQGALKKNPERCFICGRTARRQAKREKSTAYSLTGMDWIIPSTRASIPANGIGRRYCAPAACRKKYGRPHLAGSSIATGLRENLPAIRTR